MFSGRASSPARSRIPVAPAFGLAAVLACQARPATPPTETQSQPIFGGENAGPCQYPSTVLLSGCTGTLVHPRLVITAAHCGTNHRTVTFGENRTGMRKVPVESCKRVGSGANAADDYAYCKLAMPVTDVPIAPVLMGCEVDVLKAGRPIIIAGFGDADDDGGGFGTKRWAASVFNRVQRGAAHVAGKGKGYCYGDSGGPAFVKLDDGSWRSFGIVSEGVGASCGAGDLLAFMHTAVPWIEQNAGIDITPCHDANGKWNPGPDCTRFSLDPGMTGRSWANGCAEPALSPPAATCGAAFTGAAPGDAAASEAGPPDANADVASDTADARDAAETAPGTGGGMVTPGTGGAPAPAPGPGGRPAPAPPGTGGASGTPPTNPAPPPPMKGSSGCSALPGARLEETTAVVAALAFGLAFLLRRRWFTRDRGW